MLGMENKACANSICADNVCTNAIDLNKFNTYEVASTKVAFYNLFYMAQNS